MIFLLFHPATFCEARHSGRLLARDAGLRGISFVTLSQVHGLDRLIGAWR
jgi:hypothetical protein